MRNNTSRSEIHERMKFAIDSSMDGLALLNPEGKYYYLNQVHLTMFGYDKEEELVGKTWQYIYDETEINRINTDIFPKLAQQGRWKGETIGKSKSGAPVYQEISLTITEDGGIICICRDISEKINTHKALNLHDEILKQSNSMIIITNAEREIKWVNNAFTKVTGYSLEEVTGKNPGKILQGKDSDKSAIELLRRSIQKNESFETEILNYKKDGSPYWVNIKGKPLFNKEGKVEHYFAIEEDITERKKTAQLLAENNLRLEMAIRSANAAQWQWDITTNNVTYSTSWKQLLGYEEGELGKTFESWAQILHPDDYEHTKKCLTDYLTGKTDSYKAEFRLRHKKGYYLCLLDHGVTSERDSNNQPTKIIGIAFNISELKETQKQLQETKENYRNALDATGAAIWEWMLEDGTVKTTNSFLKLFGLEDFPEIASSYKTLSILIHPEDLQRLNEKAKLHTDGLLPKFEVEYRQKNLKTNTYEWYNAIGAISLRDKTGKPLSITGYTTSIQNRKEVEQRLIESERQLKLLIEASGVVLWEWFITEDKVLSNNNFARLFGYDDINELPMSYTGLMTKMVHPDDLQVVATAIRNSFTSSDSSIEIECRIKNKSTDAFEWFNIKGSITERDTLNNPLKAAGFIFGIQARKEAEEKLARAKNVAENSLKIKRKFLANISHEIRTPLHAIIGLGEQISMSELNKKQQVQINMMNESAKGLLGIINDLLDYSRIEDGKLSFESVSFNLREMLYTVYNLFEHAADKKNLKLDYEVNIPAEELFIGDPLRMRQIITNIISNAIKFTEKGTVRICFTILNDNNVDTYLLFTCVDTGIGMSAEMKRKLFEDFSQEDESFQRKYGGSGLGLSITRELVRFMGGLIEIESKKNIGTSVTIKLPLKKNNEALQDHTTYITNSIHSNEVSFESLRILAVEDNEFNRLLLKFIFEKHNINYIIAVNGKEAIRLLDEEEFDLVLMDIQMPDMDGLEATAHIRHQMNKIPIIAMTANAVKEELEAYLTLGFTDYITKPFEETALLEKLMPYLKKESTYVH